MDDIQQEGAEKYPNYFAASCGKRVIGYYIEWENAEVLEKQLKKLTHVIYLFVNVQEDGIINGTNDRAENRFLEKRSSVQQGLDHHDPDVDAVSTIGISIQESENVTI
ncbi:hypothetical protein GCK72_020681 [Caenorhabditis remanei]|uniref:Uncharacterized protein n=1 Tax=Caenorhabditis remanei TaxID=31234 RepID=A0A6A5GHG0_CAERE|nr:hypothetical protein GCK72_020681 [Caenorhabditis remanei]KAF1754123.1 hypothetical protein GCK72_020681 [Caenorhabditis remanei]